MPNNSNDEIVRSDTVQDLKDSISQSSATQAKKGEQLVSMMRAIKKAFDLLDDDIVELSTENESLKNEIGSYDEKSLQKSKSEQLKQIDHEKRVNIVMSRMEKQMEKELQTTYICYDTLWKSEFYNNVSAKNRVQNIDFNQIENSE